MNKNVGGALAVVGILVAVVGIVLWGHLGFPQSKKLDASIGLGVVLLVVGIYGFVAPSSATR